MSLLLDEYRLKLINNILLAGSQESVKLIIADAVKLLDQDRLNEATFDGFIRTIINDLELFSPLKKNAQQWSNIKMAKIYFHRLKIVFKSPAH